MSEASIIAIIGIGATLIGTIAGALISALVVGHHAKQDRLDARRTSQQLSLANTIATMREWSTVRHSNALFLSALNSYQELKQYFDTSADSWTSNELIRLNRETARAIAKSKILIRDEPLIEALNNLEQAHRFSAVELQDQITAGLREGGDKVERAIAVHHAQVAFTAALENLELQARSVLAVGVGK